LLAQIAEIEHEIPIAFPTVADHTRLKPIVLGVLPRLRGTIFIYPCLESSGFITQWELFVQYVDGRYMRNTLQSSSQLDREVPDVALKQLELSQEEETTVRDKFHAFMTELRDLAHSDLEIHEN
jgi:hypothetical protein